LLDHVAGVESQESGRPIRAGTRFAVASISKMFTAVCIARLVDAELCRFDQRLVEILPQLEPHFDRGITLASLLAHRSGLGDYIDDDSELPFADLDVAKLDHLEAFLPHVRGAPRFPAGEFRYSSAGYVLLGLAIESLTRQPFARAIARWVTAPAGLKSTGFPFLDDLPEGVAVGRLDDGRSNVGHLPRVGGPDGGIVTCVPDLQRFFLAIKHGDLISEDSRALLWQRVSVVRDRVAYGRGFDILTECDRQWFGHTGSDPGVSARAVSSTESETSVVVLCNRGAIAFRVFRLIMDWLEATGLAPDEPLQLREDG
jgi:CubicO group peptidase (beta-lactamase class C family)